MPSTDPDGACAQAGKEQWKSGGKATRSVTGQVEDGDRMGSLGLRRGEMSDSGACHILCLKPCWLLSGRNPEYENVPNYGISQRNLLLRVSGRGWCISQANEFPREWLLRTP